MDLFYIGTARFNRTPIRRAQSMAWGLQRSTHLAECTKEYLRLLSQTE